MESLTRFIEKGLSEGHSKAELSEVLIHAGWQEDEVQDALGRYADIQFPIAVPRPRTSGSAREAFLYLLTFFALYTWIVALGALLFGAVDTLLPDPLSDERYNYSSPDGALRWSVASIIVAFPIYFFLTRSHLRDYRLNPERRKSNVRRWLTYLTLFVAATVFVCYGITLIGNVLGGEIAIRFLLKMGVALSLSAGVFIYYLGEMRSVDKGQE